MASKTGMILQVKTKMIAATRVGGPQEQTKTSSKTFKEGLLAQKPDINWGEMMGPLEQIGIWGYNSL